MGPGSLPPRPPGKPPDCRHGASREGEAISSNSADRRSAVQLARRPRPMARTRRDGPLSWRRRDATTTKGSNSKGSHGPQTTAVSVQMVALW